VARKTSKRAIESDMRLSLILSKRVTGMSLRQIGQEENPPVSFQAVAQLISRAVSEMVAEPLEEVRRLELFRLDKLLAAVWDPAMAGDIAAVDRCLAISARRSRLLGLDKQVGGYAYGREDGDGDPVIRLTIERDPEPQRIKWLEERSERLRALEAGETPAPPTSTGTLQ
jgi:hypothetical protein